MTTKQPAPPSDDLLPCPICGGRGMIAATFDDMYRPMCSVDGCVMLDSHVHRTDAIKAWNTRAPDPALRIAREALEKAQQFIENGVESGYIRMPDQSLPDPAHKTLPAIRQALAQIDQLAPSREATADDDLVQVVARAILSEMRQLYISDDQWEKGDPFEKKWVLEWGQAAITAIDLPTRLQAAKDAGREEALDIVKSCFEDKDEDYDDDERSAWTDGGVFVQHVAAKAIRERIGKP